MIIFIHEDEAYLAWLAEHRRGYVVHAHRRPKARYLVLHRAACPALEAAHQAHGHLTTGPYIKVCARDPCELIEWSLAETGASPRPCEECRPKIESSAAPTTAEHDADHPHLTKQGEHLVSYLLELAVMSLDGMASYSVSAPTIAKLATYFDKSVGQLTPIVRRLLEDGFVSVDGNTSPDTKLSPRNVVHPTAAALRTVPAFAELSDAEIDAAVESLMRKRT
jgi:hypothetical protein